MDLEELYFQSSQWLRRALFVNENNPEALYLLSKLHESGYSVDRSIERAITYLERASRQGYAVALTKLAHYYYSGYSDENFRFPVNKSKAIEYYRVAMDKGDAEAANCLGLIYEQWPEGVLCDIQEQEQRLSKALECYQMAIDSSERDDALFNKGLLLVSLQQNEEGVSLITRASVKGNLRAKEYLIMANMYEDSQVYRGAVHSSFISNDSIA
ncbi:hypothetical protein FGO68_gene9598 [Halteria grandinella]|uniref:Sel1 repeat family protein n=1 Tax=Halteria grandinella TaxID=5974 RepID=A0A8J8SV37_HALGN|nr:hypothetical protein FGO68_gene9598 [Halteria grandinella]